MSDAPSSRIAAVRGAIQVAANRPADIHEATARLLGALLERNRIATSQIVSAVFTATPDLDADFPAHAARKLGWTDVPLLGAVEVAVPGSLERVVRVLLTVQGVAIEARLEPVYLDGAAKLRPDLAARVVVNADASAAANSSVRVAVNLEQSAAVPVGVRAGESVAPAPPAARRRVALVGLGQVGGSIGLALGQRAEAWERVGFDSNPATLAAALAAGAIDRAASSLAEACASAELAVIAVPVDILPATVDAAAALLPQGAALLDTGSAREGVTAALERARARGLAAVGGHPLAGSEGRGFAAARGDMFRGARFALLPVVPAQRRDPVLAARAATRATPESAGVPAIVRALLADLGAEPMVVEPGAHDAALARTSHLPYLVACALASVGADPHRRGLSGPGFRDMTRLAVSDPRMAQGYCRANAREVASAWAELRAEVDRRIAALV